jgi:hypothetical protein
MVESKMKTQVICGRKPFIGEAKRKTTISSKDRNCGAIVKPTGRRSISMLVALQLIAQKIRAKG